MKSGTFLVVGGILLASSVAGYIVYKQLITTKKNDESIGKQEDKTTYGNKASEFPAPERKTEFSVVKNASINSVNTRHYAASQAMKEAITNIANKEEENVITDNSAILKKISSDLEDLLK